MTAAIPLGVGIYMPEDAHVSRARLWLASHPGTRDRAAIAAGVRRELPGLRHQDVGILMAEVLEGVGEWQAPETWPAAWPTEWATEAPSPTPAREVAPAAAPDPEPAPAVTVPATPRPPAAPRVRVRGAPRPSRATGRSRALPGASEAVPEAIAGVPRWEGYPVRASRIPRHLLPVEVRHVAPGARWLLWRCAHPTPRKSLTMDRVIDESGVSRKGVQEWLTALRASGLMLTAYDTPSRVPRTRDLTPWAANRGPRPVDYSKLLTDLGRRVAAQLPAVVELTVGRAQADEADMGVLAALLRQAREYAAAGAPDPGRRTSDLRQVVDDAPRACARLEASGAIVADWECRGRRIRLAPEVARAWGVGC